MISTTDHSFNRSSALPDFWHAGLAARLNEGESVQAWLELDLDAGLRFSRELVALTDRRLLARQPGEPEWRDWFFRPGLRLAHKDHAGVGTLELHDEASCLASWRYTIAQNPATLRLVDAFERQTRSYLSGRPVERPAEDFCPKCHSLLNNGDEECPVCAREIHTPPSARTLLRLWRFAKPYRWPLFWGFVLTLLSTAAAMVPPYLSMPLMDDVLIPFQNGRPIDAGQVMLLLGGLLGAAVLAWGLGWVKTYILSLVAEHIGSDLRTTTFDHLMGLSLEYYGGKRTGDLMARIGSESDRICQFLSVHVLDFATDVLMIAMTAVILFYISPWLALVTLLPLPFIAWMIQSVRERLRSGFEKADRIWSEISNVLADTIPGIRVVKAFAQEARETQRFRAANAINLTVNDRVNRIWSLFTPTVTLLTEIGLLVVWAFGIWQVSKNEITVGVLTAFLAYITRFYTRLETMSYIVSTTQRAATGAKRLFDILDHVSSMPEPAQPVRLDQVKGRIEIRDVGFRYGNRAVLSGVDFSVEPGEMIGLVGHSGSGKSTLVNLICRFYDVTEGAIRLDGTDVRSLAVADYRRNIGLVLQEPFLFYGTVADNIAYGKPGASRQEIVAAARAAHAHEFILRLPQGYDSLVGERGQGLSGGERQRVSIARALLIDPRMLILDEATSSVDTETEKEIQKALDNLVRGRTTIAIAHRLSTLRRADRLVVLDRGRIVETGSHDELMARVGAYHRLYEAQARNIDVDLDESSEPVWKLEHKTKEV